MVRNMLVVIGLVCLVGTAAGQTDQPQMRAIWVDSWGPGILTPEQVEQTVADIRSANLNAIFAEVRKVGDAYYLNGMEPLASNMEGPEGWDPLQQLLDLCHDTSNGQQRIEVHAWMVTFRIWRGSLDSVPEGHLLAEHPEVLMLNASGEASDGGTVFADPGHPISEDWTVGVYRDVAERYDIDGVHFDYVRYPEAEGDWGHNPTSLERFRDRTGFEGTPAPDNPTWRAWRREQVRSTVRRVYGEVMEVNPDCLVSAATLNWSLEMTPVDWYESRPRTQAHQDWVSFMQEGILDINSIMDYSRQETQPDRFGDWAELAIQTRLDRHAVIGPGVYLNSVEDGFDQIRLAFELGADGVNLYSYNGTNNEDVSREVYLQRLHDEVFPEPAPLPARLWRETPTYGALIGQVFVGDDWVDGALITVDGVSTMLTDGTGFWGFFRLLPGEHMIQVTTPDGDVERATATVTAGRAVRVDIDTMD